MAAGPAASSRTAPGYSICPGPGTGNTFSGPTTVNAGTLYFLNAAGGAPNSNISVNTGATLAAQLAVQNATSTIGKSLTLNGASAIFGTSDNPGSAAGRQNVYAFTNALTLASGASTISVNNTQNGGFGSNADFGSLSRSAGATVLFRGRIGGWRY